LLGRYREVPETLFYQRIHDAASGNLATAAEQAAYAGAKQSRRLSSARLKLLAGHLRMVKRIPLSAAERFLCRLAIMQYVLQYRKWHKVFRSLYLGSGLGR
jgi:hypothetical protein